MAKNKNSPRRGFTAQTAYKWIRLLALAAPGLVEALGPGTPQQKLMRALMKYTGVDFTTGKFYWHELAAGYTPVLAATAVTYGIPKLAGLIRSGGK